MEKNDLVSVVIPVYNSEKFLDECIESVLNQTYQDIEIIVINDGSNDNSEKILQKYSDKITIISQENQGLASALNAGIKTLKGCWLKWFSPDDVMYPNAIEFLVNAAKKLPVNTIIYSNWELIDENGKKLRDFFENDYNDLDPFEFNLCLLDNQQINVNTSLIPISLIKKGCGIRELDDPVAIDYDFFLRAGILYETKFFLIPKNLIKYRIHSNQLSHKKIVATLEFLPKIRKEILSKLPLDQQNRYNLSILDYEKQKSLTKKTMKYGLKVMKKIFPEPIADKFLIFYLNQIRRRR